MEDDSGAEISEGVASMPAAQPPTRPLKRPDGRTPALSSHIWGTGSEVFRDDRTVLPGLPVRLFICGCGSRRSLKGREPILRTAEVGLEPAPLKISLIVS